MYFWRVFIGVLYVASYCRAENICQQELVEGPCRAAFPRWYFDARTDRCEKFMYGGCEGNDNNFEDRQKCEEKCLNNVAVVPGQTTIEDTNDQELDFSLQANNPVILTHEWQEVLAYQSVPAGAHIKLDLSNGMRYAKLDSSAKAWGKTSQHIAGKSHHELKRDEMEKALSMFDVDQDDALTKADKERAKEIRRRFTPYKELKKDLEKINAGSTRSEQEIVHDLVKELSLYTKQSAADFREQILGKLNSLEYLVHQIDSGEEFAKVGGISVISSFLNATSDITDMSLAVLGSAVQSNPVVQQAALKENLLHSLLTVLHTGNEHTQLRALFAVSAMLRGLPKSADFYEQYDILVYLPPKLVGKSFKLVVKCSALFDDLLREGGLSAPDLLQRLNGSSWCNIATSALAVADSHDSKSTLLKFLQSMNCPITDSCRTVLRRLDNEYSALAAVEKADSSDDDDYFQVLHTLVLELSSKDEL